MSLKRVTEERALLNSMASEAPNLTADPEEIGQTPLRQQALKTKLRPPISKMKSDENEEGGLRKPLSGRNSGRSSARQSGRSLMLVPGSARPNDPISKPYLEEAHEESLDNLNTKKVFTGLVKESAETEQPILEAIWMNMEFAVMLTQDEDNHILIELYTNCPKMENEQEAMGIQQFCETLELCTVKQGQPMQIKVDPTRKLLTVLLYNSQPTHQEIGDPVHEIEGYLVDFRNFSIDLDNPEDIIIVTLNTEAITQQLGQRQIKQCQLLFNNLHKSTYDMELLVLIGSVGQGDQEQIYDLFGGLTNNFVDEMMDMYPKPLENPLEKRKAGLIGFIRFGVSDCLLVFEDGFICHLQNEGNKGIISSQQLSMGMDSANSCIFAENEMLFCIQNINRVRSFYSCSESQMEHFSDHHQSKYTFLSIMGKFVIARGADKFTYLLELNENLETISQVRIGDDDTWNFGYDTSTKFQQYIILYERLGKNFQWHKYDYQNQFHLTKDKTLEQVCNGAIFRITKDKALIEMKLDVTNFEDRFYEYQHINFPGLPIVVSTYTPYAIPGETKKFLLAIKPQRSMLKRKTKPQYFVIIDCETATAYECNMETTEPIVLNKIFFYKDTCFMGQRNTSPTNYEFCEFEIVQTMEDGAEGFSIKRNNDCFCVSSKGITAFGYDVRKQHMLFIREQILDAEDECEVFVLSLRKYLDESIEPRQKILGFTVEQVSQVAAKLAIYTQPISVFTDQDELWISAVYNKDIQTVYAVVSNTSLALLYRVDLKNTSKQNNYLKFEQIITVKSVKSIYQVNHLQLAVASSTQLCVINIDSTECDDIKYLFEPDNTDVQCKRLVGRNIDFKVDFESNVVGITTDLSIITVIYGTSSLLLELDESQYQRDFHKSDKDAQEFIYKSHIGHLNDLCFVFKQILKLFYNNEGYIRISEEQGQWDKAETFCPVTMFVSDFVTLIQDEDGNQGSDESPIIRHLYLNNYNIWESILRDALATGKMEITYEQINRFLSPVVTDHGNNLMFHFCYNNADKLDEIMNLPGYEEYYKQEKKMFPIYYNFYGETQITISLKAHDNQSFYKLMFTLIKMQNCFESSFLVNTWMISAFQQGLDIFPLLESQILQTICDASILEHFGLWPQFHRVTDKITVNYDKSFMSLMHDELGYAQLFGHQFEEIEKEDEHLMKQNLFEVARVDDSRDSLFPIRYFAERLPSTAMSSEEQLEVVFQLFEILSETGQMSYFRSGFIKRLIEYHWDSQLVKFYGIVSGMYLLSYSLILCSTILLSYHKDDPYIYTMARIALMIANLIVLCLSLCTFEIKSFLSDKAGYIQSFWNQNDILLFITSSIALALEIRAFILYRDKFEEIYGFIGEEDSKDALRMLKPKKTTSGDGGGGEFNPVEYYDYPVWESYIRVTYAVLIINTHLKVLNVAQFSEGVAFIVKMLSTIFDVFMPFLLLNFSIMVCFSFCNNALDVVFYNSDSPTQGGEYDGFFGMAGPILLWTIRNGVGDFQPDTFKFMPQYQRVMMWIFWLMIVMVNVMVFMNFTIAVINDCYGEIIETREEEAYQKKCGILCELEGVFGKFAKKSPTSILVTRESLNIESADNEVNYTLKGLKKQLLVDQIEVSDKIHSVQKDLFAQNEDIQLQIEEIKDLIMKSRFRGEDTKPPEIPVQYTGKVQQELWESGQDQDAVEGLPEADEVFADAAQEAIENQESYMLEREISDLERENMI